MMNTHTSFQFFFFTIFAIVATMYLKGALRACVGPVFAAFTTAQKQFITFPTSHELMITLWSNFTSSVNDRSNSHFYDHSTMPRPGWGLVANSTYAGETSKAVCEWMGAEWQKVVPQSFDNVVLSLMTLYEMVYNEGMCVLVFLFFSVQYD